MKDYFLLDPKINFLNHGSFGATPISVFENYQKWQKELEEHPVEFLDRRISSLMANARAKLAEYLYCETDDLVYFPNPTTAINMVVRNLDINPEDEILTTDHEYGAMDRTWQYICKKRGARYVRKTVALPVSDHDEMAGSFWEGVTANTRIIFISHITSPTALIFPVEEICRRARLSGIISIVDGAHAPGQIDLDLTSLGADLYVGACHKWLCAPKGSSFLYARFEMQHLLEPLVISWGYQAEEGFGSESRFIDYHQWQGTRDPSAFLSVPEAITFQKMHTWDAVRNRCHHLAVDARCKIIALTDLAPICPETSKWFGQMFSARLPEVDLRSLKSRLYDDFKIEVPLIHWNDIPLIRVSIQGYNTQADVDKLIEALTELLV